MKCQFCQQSCTQMKSKQNGAVYWECNEHINVMVKYLLASENNVEGDQWTTVAMECHRKNETYHVVMIYDTSDPIKFRVDKISKFLLGPKAENIISTHTIPDITPENVMDKLSKYLVFS